MQEHRLQSQRRKRGGRDMTSQHLIQKENELLRYFGKQHFLIYLVCKVLYDCKKLQVGSGSPYLVITESYCNRRK
jgi:hypothetical protein